MPTLDIYAQTSFKDRIGIEMFLQAHQSRHDSYVQAAALQNLNLPASDFSTYPDDDWFNRHYNIHIALASLVVPTPNISIQNLSEYSWDNSDDFFTWMQTHTLVHQQLDQYFGNLS